MLNMIITNILLRLKKSVGNSHLISLVDLRILKGNEIFY